MEQVTIQRKANASYYPGLVVTGLRGGSGKTIFSVGIIAALRRLGFLVAPFKKGPDYIDSGWLALAAGRPCYNLDTFLVKPDVVLSSYQIHSKCVSLSIVEGNRGLYDCINTKGETSTAALAKLLKLPIVLCVDVTKITRTMAALVSGILNFDPDINLCGVVLNRVAGLRHQRIVTKSIEQYCGLPVLGAIPKLTSELFPERHMGLVPTAECEWAITSINSICTIANKYLDINAIISSISDNLIIKKKIIRSKKTSKNNSIKSPSLSRNPTIGILKDSAFQFYYPENFEALEDLGASLVFISPLESKVIPDIDALYIGGGFPETHAAKLEKNIYIRSKIKKLAEIGLPIYAECGGLLYLGDQLEIGNKIFSMSGIFPVIFKICPRPQAHGYTIVKVAKENPYYPIGFEFVGHEFHYSSLVKWGKKQQLAFLMKRGSGLYNGKDGIIYKNVLATYTHVHALGTKIWAKSLIKKATEYMTSKEGKLPIK